MRLLPLVTLAGCAGTATHGGSLVTLHAACGAGEHWDGRACVKASDAPQKLAAGIQALSVQDLDAAKIAFDAAEQAGPLDHDSNVTLWEQRGIAAAYIDDEAAATAAFDMMLALDPGHFLSYTLSPKATFVFEKLRKQPRRAPAIDVNWARGQKVGDPMPLDIDVIADPKQFLDRATVFVRTRGDTTWRAADLDLHAKPKTERGGLAPTLGNDQRIVLPALEAHKPLSLELYLRAYDTKGNEVLTWADPVRPREIALRYEPPTPWYRKWWVIAIAGSAVAIGTGVAVYELTIKAPDTVDGGVTVK